MELHVDSDFHALLQYKLKEPSTPQSRQNIINPSAGLTRALRCSKVILGIRTPLPVDLISRIADISGGLPSVLIETWENSRPQLKNKSTVANTNFFMVWILVEIFMWPRYVNN
jgi:hypothetical protein